MDFMANHAPGDVPGREAATSLAGALPGQVKVLNRKRAAFLVAHARVVELKLCKVETCGRRIAIAVR